MDPTVTIFMRTRKPSDRTECGIVQDSWFAQFGEDTALVRRNMRGGYHVTTFADLGKQKRLEQQERLACKRQDYGAVTIRPVYLWVFHCPCKVIYEGWWTYLVWRGGDSGKYFDRCTGFVQRVMELFPFGGTTLGNELEYEQWQIRFARAFCCRNANGSPRKHAGRIQGKALLWAKFCGEQPSEILHRAFLPTTETENRQLATCHGPRITNHGFLPRNSRRDTKYGTR